MYLITREGLGQPQKNELEKFFDRARDPSHPSWFKNLLLTLRLHPYPWASVIANEFLVGDNFMTLRKATHLYSTEEQVLKQLNQICDALYAKEIRDLSDLWLKVRGALKDVDYSKLKPIVLEAALLDKTKVENPERDLFIVRKFEEIGERCADQLLGPLGTEIRVNSGTGALWTKLGETLANTAINWQTDLAFKHEVDKLKAEAARRRREREKAKSKKQPKRPAKK